VERTCKKCKVELNVVENNFPTRLVNGKRYYRHLCRKCFNKYTHQRSSSTGARYKRRLATLRIERQNATPRIVLRDCKGKDKKTGRFCDLDVAFVESLIEQGCLYCGAPRSELRIGLDRVNNSLGHSKENVNPACTRCNLVRGNMPYAAWLVVSQGMRRARELNAFSDWVPGNRSIGI
jgi:hypothetical protein